MSGPLSGIRVLEMAQMVSGPLATMLLADLGADVIKIENPSSGDRYRWLGTGTRSMTAAFANTNRGKRSICLDLGDPDGLAVARDLADSSDVVVQNFRPGVATRLGVGAAALREHHRDLIYVTVSGFGPDGPYADQKVYDYVIQALTGMAALQTDQRNRPTLVKNIVIDKVTAYTVAQAVTAALLARAGGQGGQHIEVSMLDVGLAFMWPDAMTDQTFLDDVVDGDPVRTAPHMSSYYEIRPTADGYVAQMAISDRQFPGLCRVLGTEHWMDDPRFETMESRIRNAAALGELVEEEFIKYESDDIVSRLHAQDVPAAAVRQLAEVHTDPQVAHNATLIERSLPHLGTVREPRSPIRFGSTPTELGRGAPRLGEHTNEVLGELGRSPQTIEALTASGAVGRRRSGT